MAISSKSFFHDLALHFIRAQTLMQFNWAGSLMVRIPPPPNATSEWLPFKSPFWERDVYSIAGFSAQNLLLEGCFDVDESHGYLVAAPRRTRLKDLVARAALFDRACPEKLEPRDDLGVKCFDHSKFNNRSYPETEAINDLTILNLYAMSLTMHLTHRSSHRSNIIRQTIQTKIGCPVERIIDLTNDRSKNADRSSHKREEKR
ncbi:9234_t:CDS:2 [Paraglomus occultum]|uniref:9234_t:CDS:1 n=1 Tax=Paraglomus occultum TaxID=144539 RepID=A0A9N8VFL3_9GLOM|nr:9234_t:CDS:2 [Paraglomus occultum]